MCKIEYTENSSGLSMFMCGEEVVFSEEYPNKEQFSILLPLRFIKYEHTDRDLCLCLDNQGDFITLRRDNLRRKK